MHLPVSKQRNLGILINRTSPSDEATHLGNLEGNLRGSCEFSLLFLFLCVLI